MNEFAFTSVTLYNFKVSEDTFKDMTASVMQVMIEGENVHGMMSMNKLLLANKF